MRLKDKLCLVTGASSGLGRETCKLLDSLGARVVAIARREDRLKSLEAECKNLSYRIQDLSSQDGLKPLIDSIVKQEGKINGLAHFAGMGRLAPLRGENLDAVRNLFDLHVFSAYELVRLLCDKRVSNALSVVLISSISSIRGYPGLSAYSAAKGAINSLSNSLDSELKRYGGRVNAILPGDIETEISSRELKSVDYEREYANYPLGRGTPRDIAGLASFLLSPLSAGISRAHIVVDGGVSIAPCKP